MSDDLGSYLNEIGRIPLLADDSQLHLGRLIQAWQKHPDGPDKAPANIRRSGIRARERFIKANLRLVIPLARKYRHPYESRGGTMMDLIQEGNIGLARGVEKFDPELGYRAATYLYWWIRQSMSRACETEGLIRVSVAASVLHKRVERVMRELGPGARLKDACEVLGIDVEKAVETIAQVERSRCTSLDQACRKSHDDSTPLVDMIADPNSEYDVEQLDRQEAIRALQEALPDDLHLVEVAQSVTVKELAAVVGCTTKQVAHRLASAKERLREHLAQPVAVLPRQNVVQINDYRPPVTTSNGLQSLERLIEAPAAEAPEVRPAAPAKKRTRRTKEQLAAARAAKAPEQISFTVGGIAISAAPDAAVELIRRLAA